MFFTDSMKQFIQNGLQNRHSSIFNPGISGPFKLMPSLLFWNPHELMKKSLHCPYDGHKLRDSKKWTDASDIAYLPRILYGLERNVLLISRLYVCKHCDKKFRGHDDSLMSEACHQGVSPPFIVFKKTGFTFALYTYIVNSITAGK